jgi:dTDP-glucose 4,6-dehydratase
MRVLVTGAAGFLGSHLCARYLADGHEVIGFDNLLTGRTDRVQGLLGLDEFTFERRDVTCRLDVPADLDLVLHFASPASPRDYLEYPIETLRVNSLGTHNALGLARAKGARFVLASTSEVYGDPLVNPQPESYWGNVNPVGPRGCYDESKRFAEALASAYERDRAVEVRIARIFNTYGPFMRTDDGRAVPAFVCQALAGDPLTVYGDGSQTRSLCYVDDTVDAIVRLAASDCRGPVNIGGDVETTVLDLALMIRETVGSRSEVVFGPLPVDDPKVRCPDIARARRELGWEPAVPLSEGLARTVEHQRRASGSESSSSAATTIDPAG